jgi:hypothetical protein
MRVRSGLIFDGRTRASRFRITIGMLPRTKSRSHLPTLRKNAQEGGSSSNHADRLRTRETTDFIVEQGGRAQMSTAAQPQVRWSRNTEGYQCGLEEGATHRHVSGVPYDWRLHGF